MAFFDNILSPTLENDFSFENRKSYTDQSVFQTSDSRQSFSESTYSPTVIINSEGATATTTTKKETNLESQPSQGASPSTSETRSDSEIRSPLNFDTSSPLFIIGAGVVVFLVLKK